MRLFLLVPLLLATLLPVAFPATAAPPPLPDRIAGLDHPDYAVREAATEALLLDDTLDLQALAKAVPPDASPEVRQRLLHIARHHCIRQIRIDSFDAQGLGSIGIVQSVLTDPPPPWDPAERRPPAPPAAPYALVTRVLPGFPACGRLRPMDRILTLNGQPFSMTDRAEGFQRRLLSLEAGATAVLGVRRGNEIVEVTLILANSTALSGIYAGSGITLAPPFAARWDAARKPFDWPADGETAAVPPSYVSPDATPALAPPRRSPAP